MTPTEEKQPLHTFLKALSDMRFTFSISFGLVFFASFSVLHTVGLTPEVKQHAQTNDAGVVREVRASDEGVRGSALVSDPTPTRITVPSVGIKVSVNTPESRDIDVLDEALLTGAVHYPGSGNLFDETNMFLFGHSSFLPTVNNESFRAFNNLQKVKKGEYIHVASSDAINTYRVDAVKLVAAEEALVPLGGNEKKLILSTCNSFGDPGDRYIVEASFVETRAL